MIHERDPVADPAFCRILYLRRLSGRCQIPAQSVDKVLCLIVRKNVLDVHPGIVPPQSLQKPQALAVDSLGIEDWDRFQRIIEYDKADFEFPDFKSDNFMIIELTIFPGRSAEQKQSAIAAIKERMEALK